MYETGRSQDLKVSSHEVNGPKRETKPLDLVCDRSLWLMTAHFRPAPYKAGFQVH